MKGSKAVEESVFEATICNERGSGVDMTDESNDSTEGHSLAEAEEEFAEAERKRKAALLKLQLAKLEAGEDVDLGALAIHRDNPRSGVPGTGIMGGSLSVEGVIGGLGQIASSMRILGVEDETPGDAKGGPGFKFRRHAGKVRNVRLGRDGKIEQVDFEPEEWPPRDERF